MKRLTEYRVPKGGIRRKYPCFSPDIIPDDNCPTFFCEKAKKCNFVHISSRKCPYLQVMDRLAAYEDTGLEPGEVTAIKHDLMGQGIAKITEFDGIPIKRMIELAQAEKDGRLVVLPPNDPLTLDELREMDGEPIYIPKTGWKICYGIDGTGGIVAVLIGRTTRFYNYGKTWLAYRRKPEEVGT